MKLDGEIMYGHSTLAHGPDSQHFEYSDNAVEKGEFKAENEIMREDKMGIMFNPKMNKWEMYTDPLQTEKQNGNGIKNIPGRHDFLDREDTINGKENKAVDVPTSDLKLSEEETEFYTDKSVMKYELPELIVCYKEEDYHVVKDICIDDGLPSLDKILEENGDLSNEGFLSFLDSDLDIINSDLTKEEGNAAAPYSDVTNPFLDCYSETAVAYQCDSENLIENGEGDVDVMNPFLECHSETDVANQCDSQNVIQNGEGNVDVMNPFLECHSETNVANQYDSKNLIENGEGHVDDTDEGGVNVVSKEDAMPENFRVIQGSDMDNSHLVLSNLDGNEDQQKSDQDTSREAISGNYVLLSAAEESNICNEANEVPSNSKVESGSITYNFDFDSALRATTGKEEDAQNTNFQQSFQQNNTDIKQPSQTLNMPNIEEGTVDSRTTSSRSFFIQHGHGVGESSFSTVGPLSGQIAYSGPISYSGSVSLRSDSSTTSARSFAFPILHSEWNSSPVRMAKAERRHLPKHRGWRLSLLCCRF